MKFSVCHDTAMHCILFLFLFLCYAVWVKHTRHVARLSLFDLSLSVCFRLSHSVVFSAIICVAFVRHCFPRLLVLMFVLRFIYAYLCLFFMFVSLLVWQPFISVWWDILWIWVCQPIWSRNNKSSNNTMSRLMSVHAAMHLRLLSSCQWLIDRRTCTRLIPFVHPRSNLFGTLQFIKWTRNWMKWNPLIFKICVVSQFFTCLIDMLQLTKHLYYILKLMRFVCCTA